jgi:hypothetical protein
VQAKFIIDAIGKHLWSGELLEVVYMPTRGTTTITKDSELLLKEDKLVLLTMNFMILTMIT